MAKTEVLQTRVPAELKRNAEDVLGKLGLTTGQAINIFLNQIVLTQSVPLKLELPRITRDNIDRMINDALDEIANGAKGMNGSEFFDKLEERYAK